MRRIAGLTGILVAVVVVLGVGQLVLPGLAASSLRDRLSQSGRVLSVSVSAFPAVELLWHDADTVVVRMASYRSSTQHLNTLLAELGGVGTLHASAGTFHAGLLTLHDASLTKRGDQLIGGGRLLDSDLQSSIPFLRSVSYVGQDAGGVVLQGTAALFGLSATAQATVRPEGGRLVVVPDVPFGGIATVTVFANSHVAVQSVSGAPAPGGLSVSARGLLR